MRWCIEVDLFMELFEKIVDFYAEKFTIASEPWPPSEVGHRMSIASTDTIFSFSSILESDIESAKFNSIPSLFIPFLFQSTKIKSKES